MRAPNLNERSIQEVLAVIDGWAAPPLTWNALIERLRHRLGASYTRQALHRHRQIVT